MREDVMTAPRHIVVMGVAGSGKSSVAIPLAAELGYEFAEGDEFHPQANVDKMAAGFPLTDEDRGPWLGLLADWIRDRADEGTCTVVSCSALKRSYRDVLREGDADTFFVHLIGDKGLLLMRMRGREHFMKPTMLESQLEALEPLQPDEAGIEVDVGEPVADIVAGLVKRFRG